MTKWNKLLLMLDNVIGFDDKDTSRVKKVSQSFDEKTREHVALLEYRARRAKDSKIVKKPKERSKGKDVDKFELLKQINKAVSGM